MKKIKQIFKYGTVDLNDFVETEFFKSTTSTGLYTIRIYNSFNVLFVSDKHYLLKQEFIFAETVLKYSKLEFIPDRLLSDLGEQLKQETYIRFGLRDKYIQFILRTWLDWNYEDYYQLLNSFLKSYVKQTKLTQLAQIKMIKLKL